MQKSRILQGVDRVGSLFWRRRGPVVAAAAASVVPAAVSLLLAHWYRGEWHSNDWGALFGSFWLSIVFFVLAWMVGRKGQQRAEAVANAELITSIGILAMSSARSFAGHDQQALRMAADARAAMQHYSSAGDVEQKLLIAEIKDAYSDLAFGTVARADALPRSTWTGLCEGAQAVVEEATVLARNVGHRSGDKQDAIDEMASHISFVRGLGMEIRKRPSFDIRAGKGHVLHLWPAADGVDQKIRVERIRELYNRELTVVRDWELLGRNAHKLECYISINVISDTDLWYTPWYVEVSQDGGLLKPVNVLHNRLGEAESARRDVIQFRPEIEIYPEPIRHCNVPDEMRTAAINNLVRLLEVERFLTVCVLRYDLDLHDETRSIVLDGNHRLAAARKIYADRGSSGSRGGFIHVLSFVIKEIEPIIDAASSVDSGREGWNWHGFTPDISLMHGIDPSGLDD
jgi:hypothetical protein